MKHYAKAKANTTPAELDKFYGRKFNLSQFLFDKQLAFVEDKAPFKVAVCSRRAGKTISCAADLIHTAVNNKGVNCLYITLSRNNAKKIIWKDLLKINENYKLSGETDETELSMSFPNGSTIYLSGAKDESEIEKFRGLSLKLCYIDECQSFKEYIKDLIDDIIGPALIDYAGTLCLIGTPGAVPAGYFHECAVKNDVWSKHGWTFWDNPHIELKSGKSHEEILTRELTRRGVSPEDPSIQREWFGKWVLDLNSLLIQYKQDVNDFDKLPPNKTWNHILGIDVGFRDADALCVLAWSSDDPNTYLVEEIVCTKQDITDLANQAQALIDKYKVYKVVMDAGALGKKIAEEMIRRHRIPVEAADKTRKIENITFLNDALRRGHFKAKANSRFAQDSFMVEIDRDKSTPERIKVSDRFHSDIIDAVLYAFKLSPAFSYEPPKVKPARGTKEWAEAQNSEMWEKELSGYKQAESDRNLWGFNED